MFRSDTAPITKNGGPVASHDGVLPSPQFESSHSAFHCFGLTLASGPGADDRDPRDCRHQPRDRAQLQRKARGIGRRMARLQVHLHPFGRAAEHDIAPLDLTEIGAVILVVGPDADHWQDPMRQRFGHLHLRAAGIERNLFAELFSDARAPGSGGVEVRKLR